MDDARRCTVGLFIDCENVQQGILGHATEIAGRQGRVIIRRGYGKPEVLKSWQKRLSAAAFAPCMQYPYSVAQKNTSDMALALDALEIGILGEVDVFCLVTSDSDFTHLCHKLRARGLMVHVVGEPKTPQSLRQSADEFHLFTPAAAPVTKRATQTPQPKTVATKAVDSAGRGHPGSVLKVIEMLCGQAENGVATLSQVGVQLRQSDPGFSTKKYGYSKLSSMLKEYPQLEVKADRGGLVRMKTNQ